MNASFRALAYERELPHAIVTAHGSYKRRKGVIIKLSDDSGHLGIGDASPLPGFSRDTFEELGRDLDGIVVGMRAGGFEFFREFFETSSGNPSLIFALGTALDDLSARALGRSVARLHSDNPASRVEVNGLLGDGALRLMAGRARRLWEDGFRSFKVKVGAGEPDHDVKRILAIADAAPEAKLRLDANGAWDTERGRRVLDGIPTEMIEFVEQPLPVGHIKESWQMCCDYGIRLALDEEVSTVEQAQRVIDQRACDVVVLKPMVLGSARACNMLAQVARSKGMDVIYTSSWESDIGIAATLHLAAALGPNSPAMGLSTAGMIAEGIVKNPLKIENGHLKVPEGPGLGLELAPEILERLK